MAETTGHVYKHQFIEQGLRQALALYSRQNPASLITTVTLASDTREIDVSGISGLRSVSQVWVPYTASDPENPPLWRQFDHWRDSDILYIIDYYPQSGDVARVWYKAARTLSGLDSAVTTTIDPEDQPLIIDGACGFTIMGQATAKVDEVSIDAPTTISAQLMEIAKYKLNMYYSWLGLSMDGKSSGGSSNGILGEDGTRGIKIKRLIHSDFFADEPTWTDFD